MLSIVTPQQMRAIDAAATLVTPIATLIERSGEAVMWSALRMLGGTYGRRVVVLVGPGNNGNDGRVAAHRLAQRGVQVTVHATDALPDGLPAVDLVIDAAFGTGFRGDWTPPRLAPGQAVLAVDIPSGVNGLTGEVASQAYRCQRTVTFAALKPGLIFGPGATLTGAIEVADIGLATPTSTHLIEPADVAAWLPSPARDTHKWRNAVRVVAGSSGMSGATRLASMAALRSFSGMVHLSSPGVATDDSGHEYVVRSLPETGWAAAVQADLHRFGALIVGPGLGRGTAAEDVVSCIGAAALPTVIDGDGLAAIASRGLHALAGRQASTVLTPHDGEYRMLTGALPGADRIDAARSLAVLSGATVLLKGQATVIADPSGEVIVSNSGDHRLATAGTGDVLTGIVASLLAAGMPAMQAAAAGAWIHGAAAAYHFETGMVASDLLGSIPRVLAELRPR